MDRQQHREQRPRADQQPDLARIHPERQAVKRDEKIVEVAVAHAEHPDEIDRRRSAQPGWPGGLFAPHVAASVGLFCRTPKRVIRRGGLRRLYSTPVARRKRVLRYTPSRDGSTRGGSSARIATR